MVDIIQAETEQEQRQQDVYFFKDKDNGALYAMNIKHNLNTRPTVTLITGFPRKLIQIIHAHTRVYGNTPIEGVFDQDGQIITRRIHEGMDIVLHNAVPKRTYFPHTVTSGSHWDSLSGKVQDEVLPYNVDARFHHLKALRKGDLPDKALEQLV